MHENEISGIIVDCAYQIHTKLGPGLLESVYEAILAHELLKRGLTVTTQQPMPVVWENVRLDIGFRADMIVNGKLSSRSNPSRRSPRFILSSCGPIFD